MKLPPNHQSNQPVKREKVSSHLEQMNYNAAGIDLSGAEHSVCVPSKPKSVDRKLLKFDEKIRISGGVIEAFNHDHN